MTRRSIALCLGLAVAVIVSGCGGKQAAEPTAPTTSTTTTTSAVPTLTSAADLAACNELGRNLRIVSQMTTNSVQLLTNSLHPKELAARVGQSRLDLLYSAKVIELIDVPPSLTRAQAQFVHGIRQFAGDFGAAQKFTLENDLAAAAQRLADRPALAQIQAATATFTKACAPGGS